MNKDKDKEPRPAVRLSDEEIAETAKYLGLISWADIRAIEAAVLEKNGLEVKND